MSDVPLVSLTFDDGLVSQFQRSVPILEQYRLPATFFIIANQDPCLPGGTEGPTENWYPTRWQKMTWTKSDIKLLKAMVSRGHEIGSHSVHHISWLLHMYPDYNAMASKTFIEDRIETEVTSYCYPFCQTSLKIVEAVQHAGYDQARVGLGRKHDQKDLFRVRSEVVLEGDMPLKDWPWRKTPWFVPMYHGIGREDDGWEPVSLQRFSLQMAELASMHDEGKVRVMTFAECAEEMRRLRS